MVTDMRTRALQDGGREVLEALATAARNLRDPRSEPLMAASGLSITMLRFALLGLQNAGFVEGGMVPMRDEIRTAQVRLTPAGWAEVGGKPFWMEDAA